CSASLSARTRADGAAWPGIYNAVPARSFNEEASGPFVGPGIVPALAHTKVPGHVGIVADGGFDLGARVDAHGFPPPLRLAASAQRRASCEPVRGHNPLPTSDASALRSPEKWTEAIRRPVMPLRTLTVACDPSPPTLPSM